MKKSTSTKRIAIAIGVGVLLVGGYITHLVVTSPENTSDSVSESNAQKESGTSNALVNQGAPRQWKTAQRPTTESDLNTTGSETRHDTIAPDTVQTPLNSALTKFHYSTIYFKPRDPHGY